MANKYASCSRHFWKFRSVIIGEPLQTTIGEELSVTQCCSNRVENFQALCYIQGNLDIWSLLLTFYRSKFPNFVHLIEILLLFPVSNATVARGFSAMRRMKTDWRSRLDEETADHLLRIGIDGPSLSHFDSRPAVEAF